MDVVCTQHKPPDIRESCDYETVVNVPSVVSVQQHTEKMQFCSIAEHIQISQTWKHWCKHTVYKLIPVSLTSKLN